MAIFKRDNAEIYYEDSGSGDAVIALHGLIENTAYWNATGIADRISEKYRFVPLDMRGHGRTKVTGEPEGFDEETIAGDFIALADYLKIDKFHLITHSTGGFVASRWAMENSGRLLSLTLTNTTSATSPAGGTLEERTSFYDKFAAGFEFARWDQIVEYVKVKPFPFFTGVAEAENNQNMWEIISEMLNLNNRMVVAKFVRSFYKDPDMLEDKLKNITCPTLIITGEKDHLFIKSSEIMAKMIPDSKLIVYPGTGHMTAVEIPDKFADDLMDFLDKNSM